MKKTGIIQSIVFSTMLLGLIFSGPLRVSAAVVLGYVDAWQALNGSTIFYNKTVATLIAEESAQASPGHNINPRLILTILQRESSAVTSATPSSQTTAAWPMFYMYDERMAGCLNGDESMCNDTRYGESNYYFRSYNFGGVGQQIAYSSYNFQILYKTYATTYADPITVDGQIITCANIATRVLYAYTPHLVSYDTNSAFYTNWVSWWGATPNGGEYAQNNIISDANFLNNSPMTADEINTFLVGRGGWLANYTIPAYISTPYPMIYVAPAAPAPPPPRKAGDVNSDVIIDSTDLSVLADQWNKNITANTGADFNGDGYVDSTDLSILADMWGK